MVVDDRLYGRGGADDGYAAYASLAAIEAVQAEGGHHARCVGLIECSEESGSPDLPAYVEHLADRIGTPSLVVCLDSFCGDYERLWTTTSLRGLLGVDLTVEVLDRGRPLRQRQRRGARLVPHRPPPARPDRGPRHRPGPRARAVGRGPRRAAGARSPRSPPTSATRSPSTYPSSTAPQPDGPGHRAGRASSTARTWEPTLTVIGADGLPPTQTAGNVLRPSTTLALSFRLPPDRRRRPRPRDAVERALTADPPHGARVTVRRRPAPRAAGTRRPPRPGSSQAMADASEATFGQPARSLGEGGSIPFMGMLGERFPDAQFLLTGVLGPRLQRPRPQRVPPPPHRAASVTAAVALVLDAHATR